MVHKLFATMPQRFEGRQGKLVSCYIVDRPTKVRAGGYTRIRKLGQNRYGDNAPMARIEYLSETVKADE